MPWIGPVIGGAAGLIGDWMSSQGQKQQNESSQAWQERMSDTAMQRRVADLKAAGLNPVLAAGPTSGAAMGIPGAMPNPEQSFGNLGAQATGAMQLATQNAQIEATKAQAKQSTALAAKTDFETSSVLPANVKLLAADTGLANRQAQQSWAQADYIYKQIINTDADTALKNIQASIAGTNSDILKATQQALISASQSDAAAKKYGLQGLQNLSDMNATTFGKVMTYINAAIGPVTSALGAVRSFTPQTSQTSFYGAGGQARGGSVTTSGPAPFNP